MGNFTNEVSSYLFYCSYEKNLSKLSIKAYKLDLEQFFKLIGEIQSLNEISKELLQNYVKKLFDSSIRASSIKRKLISIKAFLKYMESEGKFSFSSSKQFNIQLRIPKRVPNFLGLKEINTLLTLTENELKKTPLFQVSYKNGGLITWKQFAALQNAVIVELLFSTGVRVSELCDLKIEDVDTYKKVIKVYGKGSRERSLPITHAEVLLLLRKFLALRRKIGRDSNEFLINKRKRKMQPHSIRSILKVLTKKARIPTKITPHMFRHSTATLMVENGVDISFVQKILGHSSILTTQIYTHLATNAQREIIEAKHPRNSIKLKYGH